MCIIIILILLENVNLQTLAYGSYFDIVAGAIERFILACRDWMLCMRGTVDWCVERAVQGAVRRDVYQLDDKTSTGLPSSPVVGRGRAICANLSSTRDLTTSSCTNLSLFRHYTPSFFLFMSVRSPFNAIGSKNATINAKIKLNGLRLACQGMQACREGGLER